MNQTKTIIKLQYKTEMTAKIKIQVVSKRWKKTFIWIYKSFLKPWTNLWEKKIGEWRFNSTTATWWIKDQDCQEQKIKGIFCLIKGKVKNTSLNILLFSFPFFSFPLSCTFSVWYLFALSFSSVKLFNTKYFSKKGLS